MILLRFAGLSRLVFFNNPVNPINLNNLEFNSGLVQDLIKSRFRQLIGFFKERRKECIIQQITYRP